MGNHPCRCPLDVRSLGQSMPVASPRPRPQFVSIRAQSTFATRPQTCPRPVRGLTETVSSPRLRIGKDQSVSVDYPGSQTGHSTATNWLRSAQFRKLAIAEN